MRTGPRLGTRPGWRTLLKCYDCFLKESYYRGRKISHAYMTDLLEYIIDKNYDVTPVFVEGEWIEVDTLKDFNNPITADRLRLIEKGF